MKKTIRNKPASRASLVRLAAVSLVLAGMAVSSATAQQAIQGTIIRLDTQRASGTLRWMPRSQEYLVMDEKGTRFTVALRLVRSVHVVKPANYDALENAMRTKRYQQAIPHLEKMMADYAMLQWDVPAARMLTQAYLGIAQPAEAIKSAELAISRNPGLLRDIEFAQRYWSALSQTKSPRLRAALQEAIERGSRDTAAAAQVMRGNIDFEQGNFREALVDGYLRTIMLFKDAKQIQPEALYRAVRAHERLGEHSHAEKFKRILLSEYPQSSYSKDLRSGS